MRLDDVFALVFVFIIFGCVCFFFFFLLSFPYCWVIGNNLAAHRLFSCQCAEYNLPYPWSSYNVGCEHGFLSQKQKTHHLVIGQCVREQIHEAISEWFSKRSSNISPKTNDRNVLFVDGMSKSGKTESVFNSIVRVGYGAHHDTRLFYFKLDAERVKILTHPDAFSELSGLIESMPKTSFFIVIDEFNHLLKQVDENTRLHFASIVKSTFQEKQNVLLILIAETTIEHERTLLVDSSHSCIAVPENNLNVLTQKYYSTKVFSQVQGFLNLVQWFHFRIMINQELVLLLHREILNDRHLKVCHDTMNSDHLGHWVRNLNIVEQSAAIQSVVDFLKRENCQVSKFFHFPNHTTLKDTALVSGLQAFRRLCKEPNQTDLDQCKTPICACYNKIWTDLRVLSGKYGHIKD